jgi:hypothetical protein
MFQGKTFPKIKRKGPSSGDNLLAMLSYNAVESNGNDEDITDESSISSDYVFRIVTTSDDFVHDHNPGNHFFFYYYIGHLAVFKTSIGHWKLQHKAC